MFSDHIVLVFKLYQTILNYNITHILSFSLIGAILNKFGCNISKMYQFIRKFTGMSIVLSATT